MIVGYCRGNNWRCCLAVSGRVLSLTAAERRSLASNAGVFSGIDTFTGYIALERTLIVGRMSGRPRVALLGFEIEGRSGLLRLKKEDSVVLIPRRWLGPDLPHRTEWHQATWVVILPRTLLCLPELLARI